MATHNIYAILDCEAVPSFPSPAWLRLVTFWLEEKEGLPQYVHWVVLLIAVVGIRKLIANIVV